MKKSISTLVLTCFISMLLLVFSGCTSSQLGSELKASEDLQNDFTAERALNVSVEYTIQDDWGSGFTANVKISNNTGSTIDGWTLNWSFSGNQKVTSAWNATVSQSGSKVTAKGVDWNSTISANGSISFGFQGTYSGSNAKPAAFTVNGSSTNTSSSTSSTASSSTSSIPSSGDVYQPNGFGRNATGGGNASPKTVTSASAFKSAVSGSSKKVIIVSGRINLGGSVNIGSNTTLKGANSSAGLYGGTIKIGGSNYIIQNLSFGPSSDDVMEVSGATNVFITKCVFHDSTDELCSIVRKADYVTVSWSKFYFDNSNDHSFAHLIGNSDSASDDSGKLHVTLHHNWYGKGLKGRIPRVRYGYVHIYNNLYECSGTGYCIGVGVHCHIKVENCVFKSVGNIWKDMGGKSNGEIGWKDLQLNNSTLPTFMPNKYPVFSVPYSYSLDPVNQVESIVKSGAGNVF